jgi:hypothetical protein
LKALFFFLILGISACLGSVPDSKAADLRVSPKVFSAEPIGWDDRARLASIVKGGLIQFFAGSSAGAYRFQRRFADPRFEVERYRIRDRSTVPDLDSRSVTAPGRVAIPIGAGPWMYRQVGQTKAAST